VEIEFSANKLALEGNKKREIKVTLCHEDVWRSGSIDPPFLTLPLNGDERSAIRPGRFTPRERAAGSHWIGGWVGLGACLDDVERKKIINVKVLLCNDTHLH
jgi:hypothetical protein